MSDKAAIDQEIIGLLADRNQMWADRYVQARHEVIRLRAEVRAFIRWVAANDFSDPENMLVCAEWFNLCGAVGEPMRTAGEAFRQEPNTP